MAGIEQGSLAKDYAVSQWVFGRVRVSHCWYSGWLLGSVVPWGAADSLVHEGEVLSLAEFSADTHKRHKGTAQINTETLQRRRKTGLSQQITFPSIFI